jgi:hypothetical protein
MTEDDTFDALRRVPIEEVFPIFLNNLRKWDEEERAKFIHSKGWTIADFNTAVSEILNNEPERYL